MGEPAGRPSLRERPAGWSVARARALMQIESALGGHQLSLGPSGPTLEGPGQVDVLIRLARNKFTRERARAGRPASLRAVCFAGQARMMLLLVVVVLFWPLSHRPRLAGAATRVVDCGRPGVSPAEELASQTLNSMSQAH